MKTTDFQKYNMRTEYWSYEKLSKLDPVSINRNTEIRLEKVAKRLRKKYLPTHSIIIVGHVTKAFDSYKKNDMFRLDGNTRFDIYKIEPDLIPKGLFTVIILDLDNWEDTKEIYYSIDNTDAAEKVNEKITGIFKYLKYDPVSKIIRNGKIKRAIDFVAKYDIDSDGLRVDTNYTLEDKITRYFEVIEYLDNSEVTNSKIHSAGLLACLIMVGMKYGVEHERYGLLCSNIRFGFSSYHDENEVDGAYYVYEFLYNAHKNYWTKYGVFNVSKSPVIIRTLYGFDMFMKNININKNKKWKKTGSMVPKNLELLFKNYLKKEDLEEVEI
jgi:hypothetical protein